MSRFQNTKTGVVVSVDDSKDGRFSAEWELLSEQKHSKKPKSSGK